MRSLLRRVSALRDYWTLPRRVRDEVRRDRRGQLHPDPGPERAVREGIAWLSRAQDRSTSADGGVSRHYSMITGWGPSYPETTGYIIPTMLDYAHFFGDDDAREHARRMLEWLLTIQFPDGAFQGGTVHDRPVAPVVFNTGQILMGLAAGVTAFGDRYRTAMRRAATWLAQVQEADGSWLRYSSPFALPGLKAYETHVAWGLLEAARVDGDERFAASALRNVRWSLGRQHQDGWFADNDLTDPSQPLTHTIGYALRGVIEAWRFTNDDDLLAASRRTADGLLGVLRSDGFLPGRIAAGWSPCVDWACLTGTAQVAICWQLLHEGTHDPRYRQAALRANGFVRRTVCLDCDSSVRGAVKGSYPLSGDYVQYAYPNWATKFAVDSNLLELRAQSPGTSA